MWLTFVFALLSALARRLKITDVRALRLFDLVDAGECVALENSARLATLNDVRFACCKLLKFVNTSAPTLVSQYFNAGGVCNRYYSPLMSTFQPSVKPRHASESASARARKQGPSFLVLLTSAKTEAVWLS